MKKTLQDCFAGADPVFSFGWLGGGGDGWEGGGGSEGAHHECEARSPLRLRSSPML